MRLVSNFKAVDQDRLSLDEEHIVCANIEQFSKQHGLAFANCGDLNNDTLQGRRIDEKRALPSSTLLKTKHNLTVG